MDGPSVYNSKEIHYNKNDWKLSNLTLSSQEEFSAPATPQPPTMSSNLAYTTQTFNRAGGRVRQLTKSRHKVHIPFLGDFLVYNNIVVGIIPLSHLPTRPAAPSATQSLRFDLAANPADWHFSGGNWSEVSAGTITQTSAITEYGNLMVNTKAAFSSFNVSYSFRKQTQTFWGALHVACALCS